MTRCRRIFSHATQERFRVWNAAHPSFKSAAAAAVACAAVGAAVLPALSHPAAMPDAAGVSTAPVNRVGPSDLRAGSGRLVFAEPVVRTPEMILTGRGREIGLLDPVSVREPASWALLIWGAFVALCLRSGFTGFPLGLSMCVTFWLAIYVLLP